MLAVFRIRTGTGIQRPSGSSHVFTIRNTVRIRIQVPLKKTFNHNLLWCGPICSVGDPDLHDPELLPGSGIIVPDPNPTKNERILEMNKNFISNFRPVNSGLCVL